MINEFDINEDNGYVMGPSIICRNQNFVEREVQLRILSKEGAPAHLLTLEFYNSRFNIEAAYDFEVEDFVEEGVYDPPARKLVQALCVAVGVKDPWTLIERLEDLGEEP